MSCEGLETSENRGVGDVFENFSTGKAKGKILAL